MLELMTLSGIPEKRQYPVSLMPDTVDYNVFCLLAEIKDDIVNFVDNGENLYLYSSNTGNGKTTWAIKLMLKYFDSIWAGNGFKCRGIFIHVPTFLTQLKDFNSVDNELERIKAALKDVDLVIWDDIASTDLSSYDHSQLLTYIDQRILKQKSNIFTGNLGKQDIEKALGKRLSSRVWNSSVKYELKGKDRR
jgi:DNA replication protein DnaC